MKEFENILDQAEKNIGDSKQLFAFVLIGQQYKPYLRIREFLMLKDDFDNQRQANLSNTGGSSRAERRLLNRENKKKPRNSHKKHKKKGNKQ